MTQGMDSDFLRSLLLDPHFPRRPDPSEMCVRCELNVAVVRREMLCESCFREVVRARVLDELESSPDSFAPPRNQG